MIKSSAHILISNISLKFSRFTKCHGFLYNGKSGGSQHGILFLISIQIHSSSPLLEDVLDPSVAVLPQCPFHRECGFSSGPGQQSQVPPVPPAPLQSWLAHRSCNTRGPADSQPLLRGLHTSLHLPGDSGAGGRAGVCTAFLQVRASPREVLQLSQSPAGFFSALPCQSAVHAPQDAEFLCWKLEMELKLGCWGWTSCLCSESGVCQALPAMDQCRIGTGETLQQQMVAAAFPALLPSPWAKLLYPFQLKTNEVNRKNS